MQRLARRKGGDYPRFAKAAHVAELVYPFPARQASSDAMFDQHSARLAKLEKNTVSRGALF